MLFRDGFRNVENIDYSAVVIDNMASHCDHCSQMKWHVMDATQLRFPDSSFDVVIEKATLDAMMVRERDPWNLSEATQLQVDLVLREVTGILCPLWNLLQLKSLDPREVATLPFLPANRTQTDTNILTTNTS